MLFFCLQKSSNILDDLIMALQDEDEVIFKLDQNTDGTEMTLIITAPNPMDTHDLIMVLEEYLSDLIRADGQMNQAGDVLQ